MSATLDRILKSLKASRRKSYTPRFRIRRDKKDWRIFDGEKEIARFMPLALDIWSFSPFEADIVMNEENASKVVDLHTVRNTFINFGMQGWPKNWMKGKGEDELVRWTWKKKSGKELRAHVECKGPEGETGLWDLRVSYDPAWAKYRFHCDIHVRRLDPDPMEAFNLMTAGALGSRPEERRWTHSIWENADGQLRRIVHSNALFCCTDYGGARHGGGPWRYRTGPYPQAWIGYAAHPEFNPCVLIHHTDTPLGFATCSQLFDEHIIWSRAGQDNLRPDGYFHTAMQLEIVNLPARLAADLLKRGKDPVKPKKWMYECTALPFHMGKVNDFEKPVDPWKAEDCPIFVLAPESGGHWCGKESHSGKRSIRLDGTSPHGRVELSPGGAVCRVEPHRRYRLRGWIRTRGVARFARLELASFEYTYSNRIDIAESEKVTGTKGWREVAVELDSGDEAYLMPLLVLYGGGQAWFDDVILEEVGT